MSVEEADRGCGAAALRGSRDRKTRASGLSDLRKRPGWAGLLLEGRNFGVRRIRLVGRGVAPVASTYLHTVRTDMTFSRRFPQLESRAIWMKSAAGIHRALESPRWLDCDGGRVRDAEGQDGPRRDAERRRHHGRRRGGSGAHRGRRGRVRGHGARACPGRHPPRRRRRADERSREDQGDPGGRLDPGDEEAPYGTPRRRRSSRSSRSTTSTSRRC